MAGPEALLPEPYLHLPLEKLKPVVEKDLAALKDTKLKPWHIQSFWLACRHLCP